MTDCRINFSIDHRYMDEAICPHCGHDNGSDTEHDSAEYEEECGSCGKEYRVHLEYSVHFTTEKFDREAEDAERKKRCEDHRVQHAKDMAECSKFTPGMRVRVTKENHGMSGCTGTIANQELRTMVYVNIDRREEETGRVYANSFFPTELEEL